MDLHTREYSFMFSQIAAIAILLLLANLTTAAPIKDLRDTYMTRSIKAAQLINEGMQSVAARNPTKAMEYFEKALIAEPGLDFANFQIASIKAKQGNIDEALNLLEQIVKNNEGHLPNKIVIDAAIKLAVLYIKLGKLDKGNQWFTKALLLDPEDKVGLAWKAYRNMAICLKKQKRSTSAALCAVMAFGKNSSKVEAKLPVKFCATAKDSDYAQILHLPINEEHQLEARSSTAQLQAAKLSRHIEGRIGSLLLDGVSNQIVAVFPTKSHYYHIDCANNEIKRIQKKSPIITGSFMDGRLFLSLANPTRISEVKLMTGEEIASWDLLGYPPVSLAVLPAQNVAIYPKRGYLKCHNLPCDTIVNTNFLSNGVCPDPRQQYCFSFVNPGAFGGLVSIGGKIYYIGSRRKTQSSLFKYIISRKHALPYSLRSNVAIDGKRLHLSPDGRWVALAGTEGAKPPSAKDKHRYGVLVFKAADLMNPIGYYELPNKPKTVAINHITNHIAVVSEPCIRVYHLSNPEEFSTLEGLFGWSATWSANGRYLYVSGRGRRRMKVFEIRRTAEEKKKGEAFPKKLKASFPVEKATTSSLQKVYSMEELKNFEDKENVSNALVKKLIEKATVEGRTVKPLDWSKYDEYIESPERRTILLRARHNIRKNDHGIAIYRLEGLVREDRKAAGQKNIKSSYGPQVVETKKDSVIVDHLLGVAYFATDRPRSARPRFLSVIRSDMGRTSATVTALRLLAKIHAQDGNNLLAAHCYSYVFLLDKANPNWHAEGKNIFSNAEFLPAAKQLFDAKTLTLVSTSKKQITKKRDKRIKALPKLSTPKRKTRLAADKLFSKVAPSVVLIRTPKGCGSGVCVGIRGCILTNHHVISSVPKNKITIVPFAIEKNKLRRLPPRTAKLFLDWPAEDLVVLRAKNLPKSVKPLKVAKTSPIAGTKVFAIGSMGIGMKVLEQSITDGIVSATSRSVGGIDYIQHTAAVNPGNSGGPLLDEYGSVVGINTFRTSLENVGFALPAPRVRKLFRQ